MVLVQTGFDYECKTCGEKYDDVDLVSCPVCACTCEMCAQGFEAHFPENVYGVCPESDCGGELLDLRAEREKEQAQLAAWKQAQEGWATRHAAGKT